MEELKKVSLKQGDRLVVQAKVLLSRESVKQIREDVKEWAGNTPVMVIDERFSLSVVSEEDITRYIETEIGHCGYAWVCEQCEDTRCFDYDLPEDCDFNFCPKCGRKITEFVKHTEPEDEV